MKPLKHLTVIGILLILLGGVSGCGTSADPITYQFQPTETTGSLQIQHTLAREISTYITDIKVTLLDKSQALVYSRGPLSKTETIYLEEVPVEAVLLEIQYLVDDVIVGSYTTDITILPGLVTTINDPGWTNTDPHSPQFQAEIRYGSPSGPISITTADFNGDGVLDLMTCNTTSFDLTLLLGRGDGTFEEAARFNCGPVPSHIVAGDLNGDGFSDIVVANFGVSPLLGNVAVLLNDGGNGFHAPVKYTTGDGPTSVLIADVDGDGAPDILAANFRENSVALMKGDGNGSFMPATTFPVGVRPRALSVGDLNGDGLLDLVVANEGIVNDDPGGVSVLIGNGDGTFQSAQSVLAHNNPHSVALGDLNGDGLLDAVVANFTSSDISVLIGNGNGTFQSAVGYDVGAIPLSLVLEDFNLDGRLDVAIATGGSGQVWTLAGRGDGTFLAPAIWGAGDRSFFIVTGDFDGNTTPDIAVSNFASDDVSVMLNTAP